MFIADVVFWLCLGLLFLWIFLKLIRVIETPLWLELFPLMSIGASLAVASYKIGSFFGGLGRDIKDIKKTVVNHTVKIENITEKLNQLHYDFHKHINKYHN